MAAHGKRFVFGPVPSRRLGRSLGLDLVPFKTCSYDCIYCQLGKTTEKTLERKEYAPADLVIQQVKEALEKGPDPDVITLSGSGEPTLHLAAGKIIRAIKAMTEVPVAVLTNASLLSRPEVRDDLMAADIVIPDLDAGSQEVFEIINRPHSQVSFPDMVQGLSSFAQSFPGELIIETFVVHGVNDTESEIKKIAKIIGRLGAARVQLNTVTRPPAQESARKVSEKRLRELARLFDPPAQVIPGFKAREKSGALAAKAKDVLEILKRRPCTLDDIAEGLSISRVEAVKHVEALLSEKRIIASKQGKRTYYALDPESPRPD